MSANAFAALRRSVAESGLLDTLLYAGHRGLQKLSRRAGLYKYLLVVQPVADRPLLARPSRSVSVERIGADAYRKDWFPSVAGAVDSRFAQGADCYIAFDRDRRPIGSIWIQPAAYLEDQVRARFVPRPEGQAVWDFDVFVLPEYRAGRTFAYLWDFVYARLREQGVRWTMSRISAYKAISLRSHGSLGARPVGTATFLCLGPLQLTVASVRPWLHLGLRSRPDIIVRPRRQVSSGESS